MMEKLFYLFINYHHSTLNCLNGILTLILLNKFYGHYLIQRDFNYYRAMLALVLLIMADCALNCLINARPNLLILTSLSLISPLYNGSMHILVIAARNRVMIMLFLNFMMMEQYIV